MSLFLAGCATTPQVQPAQTTAPTVIAQPGSAVSQTTHAEQIIRFTLDPGWQRVLERGIQSAERVLQRGIQSGIATIEDTVQSTKAIAARFIGIIVSLFLLAAVAPSILPKGIPRFVGYGVGLILLIFSFYL